MTNQQVISNDISRASTDFDNIIKPQLSLLYGEHIEFINIEGTNNYILEKLDQFSGLDAIAISHKQKNICGVASRIQYTSKFYPTFTVRASRVSGAKTELEKRKQAIENGYFYPRLTLQAYINKDTGELIRGAIVKTVDLFELIDNGYYSTNDTGAGQIGQAKFYVVKWQTFKDHNKQIAIF